MAGNATVDEKLAESVRAFTILYDKSSREFKDREKKEKNNMGGCGEGSRFSGQVSYLLVIFSP